MDRTPPCLISPAALLRQVPGSAGGMGGWLAAGGDVVRGAPRMSLERQVRIAAGAMVAVGAGLVFAGLSDSCAMGMLLAGLPYNRR